MRQNARPIVGVNANAYTVAHVRCKKNAVRVAGRSHDDLFERCTDQPIRGVQRWRQRSKAFDGTGGGKKRVQWRSGVLLCGHLCRWPARACGGGEAGLQANRLSRLSTFSVPKQRKWASVKVSRQFGCVTRCAVTADCHGTGTAAQHSHTPETHTHSHLICKHYKPLKTCEHKHHGSNKNKTPYLHSQLWTKKTSRPSRNLERPFLNIASVAPMLARLRWSDETVLLSSHWLTLLGSICQQHRMHRVPLPLPLELWRGSCRGMLTGLFKVVR